MTEIKVMLCHTGTEAVLDAPGWIYQRKYDGEYGQVHVLNDGSVRIFGRSKREITKQFPELHFAGLPPDSIFVGEIYVPANKDIKDKPTTSGRCVLAQDSEIRLRSKLAPAVLMVFDCIRYKGRDTTSEPLTKRSGYLVGIPKIPGFCVVESMKDGHKLWNAVLKEGEEGIVAKREDSIYEDRRSYDWLKLKTWQEDDFRVMGWTSEKREISALILDGLYKVNFAVKEAEYNRLLPLIKANPQRYMVKVKHLGKSDTGLRFPVMRDIYEVRA